MLGGGTNRADRGLPLRHHPLWFTAVLTGLTCLLLLSATLAVMLGPVSIQPAVVWNIALSHVPIFGDLIEQDWSKPQEQIIWEIRLPRVLLGAVVGAGLAVVGTAIQALVRNPLAEPYILGISSGSSVAATLVILFGAFSFLGTYALTLGAFAGAMVAMLAVYLLAQVAGSIQTTRLLLAGVSISMILSAATNFIVTAAPNEHGIRDALFWMLGSLAGAKWEYLMIPYVVVTGGMVFLLLQYRLLNALLMGEEAAATLGVNTHAFRKWLIVLLSLLIGVVVAVSGSIGFVGLIVPHIARFVVGSDHRRVLPVSALLGAVILIWADVLARLLLAPGELPIGVVTALAGGPFFIWLLRRSSYSFGGENR
ncbi:iron ABC transporter permease [Brevibacillus humidisoli]|uniref:FecCD family ABC transporter permease n=1 Tax=Brevibacillus humidisoli TaxID=2895522 RepID=UPI001E2DDC54|nr:iron ABC transporter permease [Brevibacillus humidisoli]UFJ43361.1 iron ABC transporter permease [Brevibacillus humidisoli]